MAIAAGPGCVPALLSALSSRRSACLVTPCALPPRRLKVGHAHSRATLHPLLLRTLHTPSHSHLHTSPLPPSTLTLHTPSHSHIQASFPPLISTRRRVCACLPHCPLIAAKCHPRASPRSVPAPNEGAGTNGEQRALALLCVLLSMSLCCMGAVIQGAGVCSTVVPR